MDLTGSGKDPTLEFSHEPSRFLIGNYQSVANKPGPPILLVPCLLFTYLKSYIKYSGEWRHSLGILTLALDGDEL
jgi:hypothetical protein